LGGEQGGAVATCPVQRGHPQQVTSDGEPAVVRRDDQREGAPQLLEGSHTVVLVELEGCLEVRSGGEPACSEPVPDAGVVVDLAVPDEPDRLLARAERLSAGRRV